MHARSAPARPALRSAALGTLFAGCLALTFGCASSSPTGPDTPPGGPPTTGALAVCTDGTATSAQGTAYACRGVDLAAHVTPQDLGVSPAGSVYHNTVWGWTDPQTNREYAIVGTADGTHFVDVTDPTAPVLLGQLPTATEISVWREIRVQGDLAVIVSEAPGHGLQVFDMKGLRGLTADRERVFEPTAHYTQFGSAHSVVVTEGANAPPFVYAVGSREPLGGDLPAECVAPGFHAVDLSNPANPTFAGCFSDATKDTSPVTAAGYTHDGQCMVYNGTDADYRGRQICFGSNEDVLTIFDVTDKANVRIVSQGAYPNDAYTHQGTLTSDGRYYLIDDELDETNGLASSQRTVVLDLQDLDQPEFAFVYDSGQSVIDHNQYIVGRYVYQSNYEAGLRILDTSRVGEGVLTEVGFFDTYPQSDRVAFNGQWANFPFFRSGTVLGNDINNGLFILRPQGALAPRF